MRQEYKCGLSHRRPPSTRTTSWSHRGARHSNRTEGSCRSSPLMSTRTNVGYRSWSHQERYYRRLLHEPFRNGAKSAATRGCTRSCALRSIWTKGCSYANIPTASRAHFRCSCTTSPPRAARSLPSQVRVRVRIPYHRKP